ncbi:MAG: hypothetical protein ACRBN8_22725 [Nannocystales bacterium]
MKSAAQQFLVAALALGTLACQPSYDSISLTTQSNPPAPVTVRGNRVELPAGTAVVVQASIRSETRERYPGNGELELFSSDKNVFEVYPRPDDEEFVIVGIAPGQACMDVVVDGRLEDCVDVTVTVPVL